MTRTRLSLLTALFFVCIASLLSAEPLSKIAVLDIDRVFENYPEESRVFRQIDELRETYDERMEEYAARLDELELAIIDATEAGEELEVERLELERDDFRENRKTYHEIMTRQMETAYEQIAEREGILNDILKAIEYVSIDQGVSAVLEADDSRLWWYSQEIDITDLVINRLRAIAR